jgi:hypothetical protein
MSVIDERRFLAQFADSQKSHVAQFFYSAVREGATTPSEAVAAVRSELQKRCARAALSTCSETLHREQDLRERITGALNADPAAATDFAKSVITYEGMSEEDKRRTKSQRAKPFIFESMERKPPSEKQLAFLEKLGHVGPMPTDRREASELIDALLARQENMR